MEKEIYIIKVVCHNCGWKGEKEINKGISVESIGLDECSNCGCKRLVKVHP